MNKEQFNSQLDIAKGLAECARGEGLIEEHDLTLLEDIQNQMEGAVFSKNASGLRVRFRQECEGLDVDLNAWFDAYAEDPESRNLAYPLAGMNEAIEEYKNSETTEEEADEILGKFMGSAFVFLHILSDQAYASGLFQEDDASSEASDDEDLSALNEIPEVASTAVAAVA